MTREELSELDRRIAASVARGEAAIARQEAAIAKQEEAKAEIAAISARMNGRLERADEDREDIKALIRDAREGGRELIAEMRADRERREEKFDKILGELREGRDERRAMIEGLMRMIDRLPPAKEDG